VTDDVTLPVHDGGCWVDDESLRPAEDGDLQRLSTGDRAEALDVRPDSECAECRGAHGRRDRNVGEQRRQVVVDGAFARGHLVGAQHDHHLAYPGAIEGRQGVLDASDPVLAEALTSLMMVCSFSGDADLWGSFEAAMGRAEGIPLALDLNRWTYADPARAAAPTLRALDSAIAALADESDPAQIIRIGQGASWVDRVEGCRDALWRVVQDARGGGAVASGIIGRIELITSP